MRLILLSNEGNVIESFDDLEIYDPRTAEGAIALLDIVERVSDAVNLNAAEPRKSGKPSSINRQGGHP